uniref:Secreted protein n=1 Tax=Picea glauca TaxID=3330 RepID=A0A101M543_PICGL|nr:hypothetical protein ABT39_MTgene900 [Picea glauca]
MFPNGRYAQPLLYCLFSIFMAWPRTLGQHCLYRHRGARCVRALPWGRELVRVIAGEEKIACLYWEWSSR